MTRLFLYHLVFLLVMTNVLKFSSSANILFFIALGSHSHRTAIEPLAHRLVDEGHKVTFLAPMLPTVGNVKFEEFSPKKLTEFYNTVIAVYADDYFQRRLKNKYSNEGPNPPMMAGLEEVACGLVFNSPEFKPWVARHHFDLVILDHTGNKCAYALAYKFNASTILNSALGPFTHEEDQFGYPISDNAWLQNIALTNVFTNDRTFYDKVYVTLYRLYSLFYTNWIALPKTDELVRRVLDMPDMPPTEELEKNTSLVFINQHFSNDYPRSLPPHVIQVGGMHCIEKASPLPKNLQDFIDGAGSDGFIYMSFGTIVSMSKVPMDFVNSLFDTVSRTKARFVWKWDSEPPANLPKNVLTAKWFPQQDLLASKSIRAFVTHGGQMSTHQGICHGVPMIVVPVAFDQPYNAQTVKYHDIGIHLELSEMKEKFWDSLNSILNDKKYQKNAKLMSQRFHDRPLSPLDTAHYWTNYVLRHRDVSYMRPMANLHQTWWQRRLLDVWAFLFSIVLIIFLILFKLFKWALQFCLSLLATASGHNVKSKRL